MESSFFKDRVAVVTGGASGIGEALCRELARQGARIGLMDMDAAGAERLAQELAEGGTDVLAVSCDVSDRLQCESRIGQMIAYFGGIDILVNNAGITHRSAFAETGVEVFRKVMEVNFFGALHCTKAAMESLLERRGMIVVNESIAGFAPLYGRTGYSASKHALHGLFTSLRSEIRGAGVHVMIACPGFTRTGLQTRALGEDGRVTTHPQSRVGRQDTPEHVARTICRALRKRKAMVVLTPAGKISYWISRLFPVLYEHLMAWQLRSELVRKGDAPHGPQDKDPRNKTVHN